MKRNHVPALLGVALLIAVWQLPGLIGRDPWKPDEAYTMGLVQNIVETDDWLVPTLGSDPFMEKPPIFFIAAAAAVRLDPPLLEPHEAARLATLFYNVVTLACLAIASRALNGKGRGWPAAVLLLGCVGPQAILHFLITDVALLTGVALAFCGLATGPRRPFQGGLVCGTGAGLAFLAKGLIGPGLLGLTVLALPVFMRTWRSKGYWLLLAGIATAALPWVSIWPWLLYRRSPKLFMDWFWVNNFQRFLGTNELGPPSTPFYFLELMLWYALPALPLAIWSVWRGGVKGLRDPGVQLPLVGYAVMFIVLSLSRDAREIYAFPMLVPLFLLAAREVDAIGARTARVLNGFAFFLFSLAALAAWAAWLLITFVRPEAIMSRLADSLPGFVPEFGLAGFLVALAATAGWVTLMVRHGAGGRWFTVHWAAGLSLAYLLSMTLFLPAANWNMSYRRQLVPLRDLLPPDPGPIASRGVDEPQRAMLHYFGGVRTLREESRGHTPDAPWMLIQSKYKGGPKPPPPGPEWTFVWDTVHDNELFQLFRRPVAEAGHGGEDMDPTAEGSGAP